MGRMSEIRCTCHDALIMVDERGARVLGAEHARCPVHSATYVSRRNVASWRRIFARQPRRTDAS